MRNTFGQFIRNKRLEKELILRDFCKKSKYDVGYISRLENDILKPPVEEEKLDQLALALSLNKKTQEWETFHSLADVSNRRIPKEINQKTLHYLPAFFRKASKKNITKHDVNILVQLIQGERDKNS